MPQWSLLPGFHTPVKSPPTWCQGCSVSPAAFGTSDDISLMRLGYKRLWLSSWLLGSSPPSFSFSLSPSLHFSPSLPVTLSLSLLTLWEASWHVISSPAKRPMWRGAEASCQQPCEWAQWCLTWMQPQLRPWFQTSDGPCSRGPR